MTTTTVDSDNRNIRPLYHHHFTGLSGVLPKKLDGLTNQRELCNDWVKTKTLLHIYLPVPHTSPSNPLTLDLPSTLILFPPPSTLSISPLCLPIPAFVPHSCHPLSSLPHASPPPPFLSFCPSLTPLHSLPSSLFLMLYPTTTLCPSCLPPPKLPLFLMPPPPSLSQALSVCYTRGMLET